MEIRQECTAFAVGHFLLLIIFTNIIKKNNIEAELFTSGEISSSKANLTAELFTQREIQKKLIC